jgi:hypothetical protein
MKLYRIDTREGYHYATAKYLEQAKRDLTEEGYEDLTIERLDFEISKAGIFDALEEGTNAAGGHETALRIWADGEWV